MSNSVKSVADLEAALAGKGAPPRLVHWYSVPEELSEKTGVKKLGFVELTAKEELRAHERAGKEMVPAKVGYELAKESLWYVDKDRLSTLNDTADAWWDEPVPSRTKLRQLAVAAYGQIHQPDAVDLVAFLGSHETAVG